MDLQLAGRLALITGASRGIGRAVALMLAEEGCDLVLAARDQAALDDAADAVRRHTQVAVRTIAADLSTTDAVKRVADEAGEIDILVNNAGAIPPGDLLAVDEATWRTAWDLKVFGYINLSRSLLPALKRRRGVIVNIIGAAGERFDSGYVTGSSGNAALMAFTRALGRGVAQDGVRVVGINPGPVATERMKMLQRARARAEFGDETRWAEFVATMPYGRAATPEEIAAAAAFLASPRSGYTNGTILTIDGGAK